MSLVDPTGLQDRQAANPRNPAQPLKTPQPPPQQSALTEIGVDAATPTAQPTTTLPLPNAVSNSGLAVYEYDGVSEGLDDNPENYDTVVRNNANPRTPSEVALNQVQDCRVCMAPINRKYQAQHERSLQNYRYLELLVFLKGLLNLGKPQSSLDPITVIVAERNSVNERNGNFLDEVEATCGAQCSRRPPAARPRPLTQQQRLWWTWQRER